MAGYKQSVLDLNPICFLTFDGDSLYNKATSELTHANITDESLNGNNGILQTNTDRKKSYLMGQNSLVPRENNANQASFTFAPFSYDIDPNIDFPWEKTLVEVLHNETMKLDKDYSIMFIMNKKNNEDFIRSKYWDEPTNTYKDRDQSNTSTFKRTIFRKGPFIEMVYEDYWWYSTNKDSIVFKFPGSEHKIILSDIIGGFYDKTLHIVVNHKVIKLDGNLYKTQREVYINGVRYINSFSNQTTTPFSALSTSPLEIGGNRDASDPNLLNDRQTTPLTIDQFAVFDKALDGFQIINSYKKMDSYINLIKKSGVTLYVPFADRTIINDKNIIVEVGDNDIYTKQYSDIYPYITREQILSSDRIGTEKGVTFKNANARIQHRYNNNIINASGDFSMEFWASFNGLARGVMVSCQSNKAPFKGILVEVNRLYHQDMPGMIQVRLTDDVFVHAPEFNATGGRTAYNDGIVRHYAITRTGTSLRFYIDGFLADEKEVVQETLVPDFGTIYFMGMAPSDLNVNGIFGQFAFYNRALSIYEIAARSYFNVKMLIKGRVTLQGQPYSADIRVYDHNNGKLLHEYKSQPDGNYVLELYTNNYIDLTFLDKQDDTIAMRTLGPLLPQEFIDN